VLLVIVALGQFKKEGGNALGRRHPAEDHQTA